MSIRAEDVDLSESGAGPLVVLVHCSAAGAWQWRKLSEQLAPRFRVKAVNMYGYGRTPAWSLPRAQAMADQAALVKAIVPLGEEPICLVGHSFGGSVAMHAAATLGKRVSRLVLLEPNPFTLLQDARCDDAFAEASRLRDIVKTYGAKGEWAVAAENFADYWGSSGVWRAMSPERRLAFAQNLKPNFHEWDAIMDDRTSLQFWAEHLPVETLVIYDENTVRPIREIISLMRSGTSWKVTSISHGGHMAPLTRPDLVNPMICDFLK